MSVVKYLAQFEPKKKCLWCCNRINYIAEYKQPKSNNVFVCTAVRQYCGLTAISILTICDGWWGLNKIIQEYFMEGEDRVCPQAPSSGDQVDHPM